MCRQGARGIHIGVIALLDEVLQKDLPIVQLLAAFVEPIIFI
jgi:hypothetical protein